MVTSMRLQIVIANDAISGYPDRDQIVKKITILTSRGFYFKL